MLRGLKEKTLVLNQLGFVFAMLVIAAIGMLGLYSVEHSAERMGQSKDVVADILPPPLYLIEAHLICNQLVQAPPDERAVLVDTLQQLKRDFDARNHYWSTSTLPPDLGESLLGKQRVAAEAYWREVFDHFLPTLASNDHDSSVAGLRVLQQLYAVHRRGVDATVVMASAYAEREAHAQSRTSVLSYAALGLSALVAPLLILLFIQRTYRSLKETGSVLDALSTGDLAVALPARRQGEVGQLLHKIGIMRDNLLQLVHAIRANAQAVGNATEQLKGSAAQGTDIAGQQAEAAAAIAAAVEQISVSIEQVRSSALEASRVTRASSERSGRSVDIIGEAISRIEQIAGEVLSTADSIRSLDKEASEVSAVVQVIRGIAEQTSLLALNAAIEAARAGESGRGFAVVADEVRKLSENTSQATVQISGMIERMQQGTRNAALRMDEGVSSLANGVELAGTAGQEARELQLAAERIHETVDSITLALNEQAAATRDIAVRVEKMAQGSQHQAHAASATHASSHTVDQLARELEVMTQRFQAA